MVQGIERAKQTTPDLNAVVGLQTQLLRELAQLMGSLNSRDVHSLTRASALLTAGLAGLQGKAPTNEAPAADVEVQKFAFLQKFGIQVIEESKVSFTLPKGASILDLLNDAQALAHRLHNQDAIFPDRLNTWSSERAFSSTVSKPLEISIDGNVSGSTDITRVQQVEFLNEQNLAMPPLEHLAAAHAAYFIATGEDLFDGNVVRARGGALGFLDRGLSVSATDGGLRAFDVAASAALTPRN